jgi:cobalamin biosynthesis protein CobT
MSRPKVKASDEQRQKVKALAGYGLSHQEIATVAGVGSVITLRKYFHEELRRGPLEAQSNVMRALFRQASSGRNSAATMFWLKTRAGWSEQGKVEEREVATSTVWEIHEYQPPRSPEEQKWVEEALRGFDHTPDKPVRWEGDQGHDEGDEEEAPRRRRPN